MLEPDHGFLENPECPHKDRAAGASVPSSGYASSLCPAPNTETKPLLTWKKAQDTVPWNIILLLGGGFAMAKGCEVSAAGGLQAQPQSERLHRPCRGHSSFAGWDNPSSHLSAWCCAEGEEGGMI